MCMRQILAVFTKAQLQTFRNILFVLHSNEKTIEEALEYIAEITKVNCEGGAIKLCPKCKQPMRLFQVNFSEATQIGGDFQTQWQCMACKHDIFSKNTIDEELKKLRRLQNGTR